MPKATDGRLMPGLFLAMVISVLVASTLFARPAFAENIAVTTKLDEDNTDGDCSLREAIIAANTDAPRDACPGGTGLDTITMPAGIHKVSILGPNEDAAATGDLDLTGPTIITGAGARETTVLAGTGFNDRVFDVFENTAIFDLTISGGNASIIPRINGVIFRDGGGIVNHADELTLSEVVVDGNTADGGGGIYNTFNNSLNIFRSTLSNNTAENEPFGEGGALLNNGGTVTITNSTFADNTAIRYGGAIYGVGGGSTITNSTIADNIAGSGGGIGGTSSGLEIKNTIVAKNFDTTPGIGTDDCDGPVTSLGNNLDSFDTCGFDQPTDLPGIDPNLGSLRDNGGPTDTLALLAGSRAVDAASSTGCPASDQRGEARPTDGNGDGTATCDIGAFEREAAPDTIAPTVKRVAPEEDATEVGLSKNVTATFSEAMDESSVDDVTFKLLEASTDTPVEATVSYDAAKKKAILNPDAALQRDLRYQAIVTNSVKDEAGNRLDEDPGTTGNQRKVWFFTTRN